MMTWSWKSFKDIFPDKNIEAALIGMNNFNQMQAKAKQLVQIYRPKYTNDSSSLGACLMHNHEGDTSGAKPKVTKSKVTNQHQLAPTQHTGPSKQGNPQGQSRGGYKGNNITQDPAKVKITMDITGKIILGIVSMGLVVGEDKVEAENIGIVIIQMIEAKTHKGKIHKEEGVEIKTEAEDAVITHNRVSNKHIIKVTSHLRVHIPIWLHPPCPHKTICCNCLHMTLTGS